MVRFFGFPLKNYGFGVLPGLQVFSNVVFGFRVLSKMIAVFRIFLSNAFSGFSGFAKEITSCSTRDYLYNVLLLLLEEWMIRLVRLAAVICNLLGRNGRQADYEKPKMISKQKTILKYHAPGITYLVDFDLIDRTIELL